MNDHLLNIFSESGCPSSEMLVAYFRNSLPEEERYLVEKHLVDCRMCSDELEGLSQMQNPERLDRIVHEIEGLVDLTSSRGIFWNRRVLVMAVAAAIIFLAGSVLLFRLVVPRSGEIQMAVTLEAPAPAANSKMTPPPSPLPEHAEEKKLAPPSRPFSMPIAATVAEDTQTSATELMLVAGITSSAATDSAGTFEIVEKPAVTSEEATVTTSREQAVPKDEEVRKSQAMLFAASPGKGDTMSAALALFNSGNYRMSLDLLSRIITGQPYNFKALFYSALCSYELGDPASAVRTLEKILGNPGNDYYRKGLDLSEKIRKEQDSTRSTLPDTLK